MLLGGDGDDVLLGGPGTDVIDGGPGDNVVIQSLGADAVRSAAAVGNGWLKTHARTVRGKTVLDVGGEQRKLPRADLAGSLAARPRPEPLLGAGTACGSGAGR